jgi:hypothetical protein
MLLDTPPPPEDVYGGWFYYALFERYTMHLESPTFEMIKTSRVTERVTAVVPLFLHSKPPWAFIEELI